MSHTTTIETQFLNAEVLAAAATKLGLSVELDSEAKLFQVGKHKGTVIKLPGWSYPIIVAKDGTVAMDNYNGHWGKMEEFNKLKQEYATEVARRELKRKGIQFRETRQNGQVKLVARL